MTRHRSGRPGIVTFAGVLLVLGGFLIILGSFIGFGGPNVFFALFLSILGGLCSLVGGGFFSGAPWARIGYLILFGVNLIIALVRGEFRWLLISGLMGGGLVYYLYSPFSDPFFQSMKPKKAEPVADTGKRWSCPGCGTANMEHLTSCTGCGRVRPPTVEIK